MNQGLIMMEVSLLVACIIKIERRDIGDKKSDFDRIICNGIFKLKIEINLRELTLLQRRFKIKEKLTTCVLMVSMGDILNSI